MTVAVSLLRGINVGGRNKIRMADLRELYRGLGLSNVQSLLQSGNVLFEAAATDLAGVGQELEAAIRANFGLDIHIILRSSSEFHEIFSRHRFCDEQLLEPRKIAVVFLSDTADSAAVDQLRESNPGREIMQAVGRELYIFYTDGMARSKLDSSRIERALRVHSTARNWNTCKRISKLLAEYGA
ncbi:MAG: DUF1697 domain-containing protein [Chloroflexi bacterium]|nr:DUF1697 domain-containing protein [Chloroflexota bacterium]